MNYNPKTKAITVDGSSESLARGTAGFFLDLMADLGSQHQAPVGIAQDWLVMKQWLGATSDNLTKAQKEKWEVTYLSYLADGRPPSKKLEEFFRLSQVNAKRENWKTIPLTDEIRGVLDRLFASDEAIKEYGSTSSGSASASALTAEQHKPFIRRLIDFVARLRYPPEVNVALSALGEVRPLFRSGAMSYSAAVDLAFSSAANKLVREKERTVHSISGDQWKPRDLALLMLSQVASRELGSGNHHVYRGVLNSLGHGYLYVFETAVMQLSRSGFITVAEAEADMKSIRNDIRQVG